MIKVTVLAASITKHGTFKNDAGEPQDYTTVIQKGRMESNGFAYPYDVRLEDGQQDYPQGDYELDVEAMIQVNKGKASLSKFTVLKKAAAK